jgi:hypothetical protein
MGELSDRFAELMARMAKTDAELFRTIGEQNTSVRQMVDDFVPASEGSGAANKAAALGPAALLAPDQCDQKALKARFGKVAEAQNWVERQIGKGPKKATWLVIEHTCRNGSWPAASAKPATASKAITAEQLDQRLTALETTLTQRFDRLEQLLLLIAEQSPLVLGNSTNHVEPSPQRESAQDPEITTR